MGDEPFLKISGVATLDDPTTMLGAMLDHFVEHGTVTRDGTSGRIDSMIGNTALTVSARKLEIDIECAGEGALFSLKSVIAEHLFMFAAGKPLALSWSDGGRPAAIPDFREATVVTARNVTPYMRRVTVSIADIDRYEKGSFHLRLLIPPKGRTPVWPHAGNDGRIVWPKDDDALTVRIYTVRALDPKRGQMDIDIVLHEGNETPGATWVLTAQAGDRVGVLGPGGGGMPSSKRLLLVGDETALPAIARIAARLDADADVRIFIEVECEGEEQDLVSPARIEPVWLYRNGRKAGTARYLEAVIRTETEHAPDDRFIWVAGEQSEAVAIRHLLRDERGYDRKNHMIAAYWRKDQPDNTDAH